MAGRPLASCWAWNLTSECGQELSWQCGNGAGGVLSSLGANGATCPTDLFPLGMGHTARSKNSTDCRGLITGLHHPGINSATGWDWQHVLTPSCPGDPEMRGARFLAAWLLCPQHSLLLQKRRDLTSHRSPDLAVQCRSRGASGLTCPGKPCHRAPQVPPRDPPPLLPAGCEAGSFLAAAPEPHRPHGSSGLLTTATNHPPNQSLGWSNQRSEPVAHHERARDAANRSLSLQTPACPAGCKAGEAATSATSLLKASWTGQQSGSATHLLLLD